jgi:hypothetical protein
LQSPGIIPAKEPPSGTQPPLCDFGAGG